MISQQIMMTIVCFLIGDGDAEESVGRVVHQAVKREEQGAGDEEHWEQVKQAQKLVFVFVFFFVFIFVSVFVWCSGDALRISYLISLHPLLFENMPHV